MIWNDSSRLAEFLSLARRDHPVKVVMASLYADPLHGGHLAMLKDARRRGDVLVVAVNGDRAAIRKKGYVLLPQAHRAAVVDAVRWVDHVVVWDASTVEGLIKLLRPDVFVNGGDRSTLAALDRGEVGVCREVGCEVALGVGGDKKFGSSSDFFRSAVKAANAAVAGTGKVSG